MYGIVCVLVGLKRGDERVKRSEIGIAFVVLGVTEFNSNIHHAGEVELYPKVRKGKMVKNCGPILVSNQYYLYFFYPQYQMFLKLGREECTAANYRRVSAQVY